MKETNQCKESKQAMQGMTSAADGKEVYLPPRVEVMKMRMERGYAGSGTGNGWPGPNRP